MAYDRTLGPTTAPTVAPTGAITVDVSGGDPATADDIEALGLTTTDDTFDAVIMLAEKLDENTRVLRSIDHHLAALTGRMPEG